MGRGSGKVGGVNRQERDEVDFDLGMFTGVYTYGAVTGVKCGV